jgi:hypothetical protein
MTPCSWSECYQAVRSTSFSLPYPEALEQALPSSFLRHRYEDHMSIAYPWEWQEVDRGSCDSHQEPKGAQLASWLQQGYIHQVF